MYPLLDVSLMMLYGMTYGKRIHSFDSRRVKSSIGQNQRFKNQKCMFQRYASSGFVIDASRKQANPLHPIFDSSLIVKYLIKFSNHT